MPDDMLKITCKDCGRQNVPDWDGKGHCITCARDRILGAPTNLREERGEL